MVPYNNKRINETWHKQLTKNKCYAHKAVNIKKFKYTKKIPKEYKSKRMTSQEI